MKTNKSLFLALLLAVGASGIPGVRAGEVSVAATADQAAVAGVSSLFAATPAAWTSAVGRYVPAGPSLTPVAMLMQSQGFTLSADAANPTLMRGGKRVTAEAAAKAVQQARMDSYLVVNRAAQDLIARSQSGRLSQDQLLDLTAKLRLMGGEGSALEAYLTPDRIDKARQAAVQGMERLSDKNKAKLMARMQSIAAELGQTADPGESAGGGPAAVTAGAESAHASGLAPADVEAIHARAARGMINFLPPVQGPDENPGLLARLGRKVSRFLSGNSAPAAPRGIIDEVRKFQDEPGFAIFDFEKGIAVPQKSRARMEKLAKKYDVPASPEDFGALIESVYRKIGAEGGNPLDKGEKMAQFAQEADVAVSKMPDKERRILRYEMASAVLQLEAWKPSEFRKGKVKALDAAGVRLKPEDYLPLAASYVDQTEKYRNLVPNGQLLYAKDLRQIAAHNLWPVYLKDHDMRHAHYVLGHPLAAATYFQAARSRNDLRYALVSSAFEGVDDYQTKVEQYVVKYLKNKRKMDLEEGMVYMAMATRAELEWVLKGSRTKAEVESSYVPEYKDWKPEVSDAHPGLALDGELNDMVRTFTAYLRDKSLDRIRNYDRAPDKGGAATDNGEKVTSDYW